MRLLPALLFRAGLIHWSFFYWLRLSLPPAFELSVIQSRSEKKHGAGGVVFSTRWDRGECISPRFFLSACE
jgi:hypothetical protein